MTFNKIKREDLKTHKKEAFLSSIYTLIIAVVYAYWIIVTLNVFWYGVLVFFGFVLLGMFVGYLWINSLINKDHEEETEEKKESGEGEN